MLEPAYLQLLLVFLCLSFGSILLLQASLGFRATPAYDIGDGDIAPEICDCACVIWLTARCSP